MRTNVFSIDTSVATVSVRDMPFPDLSNHFSFIDFPHVLGYLKKTFNHPKTQPNATDFDMGANETGQLLPCG